MDRARKTADSLQTQHAKHNAQGQLRCELESPACVVTVGMDDCLEQSPVYDIGC